jgi:archaeal type IV pilus assembly protein PilA
MYKKNDEAVSPVIGVILMVAITVILAAVIAAFVFGMAGQLQKTKIVAVTPHRDTPTQISVTNFGGQDITTLSRIDVTGDITGTVGIVTGNQKIFTGLTTGTKHVIIVGTFTDGTQQVLLDTQV